MTHLVPAQRKFGLPDKATPDSISEMVRAILSQKAVVQRMELTAEPPLVQVEMLVPSKSPGPVKIGAPHVGSGSTSSCAK